MTLGEHSENEAQLNGVVELMLDITESSVAFCWELGAGSLLLHCHASHTRFLHSLDVHNNEGSSIRT